MTWHGHLQLNYRLEGGRTIAHDRHEGPLRVLRSLYPEGPGICHHVLVHPPGGLAGGDVLEVEATLESGTHALLTTPGATRFYRSEGGLAVQRTRLQLADSAPAEWLPLETLAYRSCRAENHLRLELAPGAEALGWDIVCLGLPAAGDQFDDGDFLQHLELPGQWLERGRVHGQDKALLRSPLGWAGHRVLGTLWCATGTAMERPRREALLDAARAAAAETPLAATAGSTAPHGQVVVMRVLADRVEPIFTLLAAVRGHWRQQLWQLAPEPPRIWRT